MKRSYSCLSIARFVQARFQRAKVLCPTAIVAAFALALPNPAPAQSNILVNPGMETGDFTGWTTYSGVNWDYAVANTNGGLHSAPTGLPANADVAHSGQYSLFLFGDFQGPNQYDGVFQDNTTVTAGDIFTADTWIFSFGDDFVAPPGDGNQTWVEVTFRDATKSTVLALYRSLVINSNAANVIPTNAWVHLLVTNQYDPTTFAITNTVTNIIAPPGAADVRYQIVFNNVNYGGGSTFWDDNALNFISGPVPPTISAISPNAIILCTNTALTCSATSSSGTITNVQVITTTSMLGVAGSTTVSNNLGASPLTVTGLGTATADISFALTTNLIYKVTVVVTDNNGVDTLAAASFDTLSPALVIEAEDFNFGSGQFLDTPADGGLALYINQVGMPMIDENKKSGTAGTTGYYRTADAVTIQGAAPGNGTEQKYVTAAANGDTVNVPQEVGYNSGGDWLDYTRTFGSTGSAAAGTYYVWARLATVGSGPALNFYQITGGQGTTDQASNQLGSFSFTDNGWNSYVYAPLLDHFGNLVPISLSGQATLRSSVTGNPNIDFYMLVPAAPILTPSLHYAYPDGLQPFEPTNSFTFTVGPANGAGIDSSGIDVVLNGLDITSKLALTGSTNSWTGSYPILSNAVYAAVINVTNLAGSNSSFTLNFDTFDANNYQWEAVDYDFSTNNGSAWFSGLFIDNPVPTCDTMAPQTGKLATNSYFGYPTGFTPGLDPNGMGAVAQQGIDIYFPDAQTGNAEFYRADGVGSTPATDYVRPKFLAAQQQFSDLNIGPMLIGYFNGGNWLNYTRTYPTNNYYVWARLAGGFGPFSGTALSQVIGGLGTSNQTTALLGTFSDPFATGWQAWHWIPLRDTSSNLVVVSLGGKATLRLTSGNNLNTAYFMLAPAPFQFKVTPSMVAGQFNLSFPTEVGHTYTIVHKSSLTDATWTPVGSPITGNGSPQIVAETLTGTQGYYAISAQ